MSDNRHLIEMPRGGRIALHRLSRTAASGIPVIVAHGTISNADTIRTLGRYLADEGFDCWLLEWAGHGHSEPASPRQNFEYPAFNDLPTAIDAVRQETGHQQVLWVAHSGGGHLPLMYLCRHPEQQSRFAGIITLGTQSTHAAPRFREHVAGMVLWGVTRMLNRTPRFILPLGNEHEPTYLLLQWAKWNMRGQWRGEDGFDYMSALSRITVPVAVVAGQNDTIAPVDGCRRIYDALGSPIKTWILCAESSGFSKDLAHGQLIRGTVAQNEVFPRLVQWLKSHTS